MVRFSHYSRLLSLLCKNWGSRRARQWRDNPQDRGFESGRSFHVGLKAVTELAQNIIGTKHLVPATYVKTGARQKLSRATWAASPGLLFRRISELRLQIGESTRPNRHEEFTFTN